MFTKRHQFWLLGLGHTVTTLETVKNNFSCVADGLFFIQIVKETFRILETLSEQMTVNLF